MKISRDIFLIFFSAAFIFITIGFAAGAEDRIICDFCKRIIDARYYEFKDEHGHKIAVCESCYLHSNKCELCGIPVGKYDRQNGVYLCSSCRNDAKFCSICGALLKGRYFKTENSEEYYCPDCFNGEAKCALCKKPVIPPKDWDRKSRLLCADCSSKALYCSRCGALIDGEFGKFDKLGEVFCQTCLKTAPKCHLCKKPLLQNEGNVVRDKVICDYCFNKAERCALCGLPIVSSFYTFKYSEGKYCEWCIKNNPACSICSRPIGGEIFMFPDGRRLCKECHSEVIMDIKEIEKIKDEIVLILKKNYNINIQNLPQIEVVSSDKLKTHFDEKDKAKESPELGIFWSRGGKEGIYILEGLPKSLLYETLAHEIAHSYQFDLNPKLTTPKIVEGFAQWIASKILLSKGYYPQLDKLQERDDIYGQGFREVQYWELKNGFNYVVNKIKGEK